MATHDVVGESIDSGIEVCRVLYIGGTPFDGGAATSDWIEIRRETPLNPAIVECPLLGVRSLAEASTGPGKSTSPRYYCCYRIIPQARLV